MSTQLRRKTMTVHGTYVDGRVELDVHVEWPEGSRVMVYPAQHAVGLCEESWHDSEQDRALLLARIDALEPVELTLVEQSALAKFSRQVHDASREAVRRRMDSAE